MHQMQAGAGDVIHMDAAEHLIGLQNPSCRSGPKTVEHRAAGSVNAGKSQDLHREAGVQPGLFTGMAPLTARLAWISGIVLRHPAPLLIPVDAGGGEIANPGE